jgi:hypothetical protein
MKIQPLKNLYVTFVITVIDRSINGPCVRAFSYYKSMSIIETINLQKKHKSNFIFHSLAVRFTFFLTRLETREQWNENTKTK